MSVILLFLSHPRGEVYGDKRSAGKRTSSIPFLWNTHLILMFEQLLVVDFSSVLAGPVVGQFLAELGARVVKIENAITGGDVSRRWKLATEPEDDDRSAYFLSANAGKESLALNLDVPEDRELCRQLVAKADILIHNFKPGDERRWNLDYEHCRQLNHKLIYASIDGFGPDNPRVGYDAVIQAESGFMAINGQEGSAPTKLPVALMDVLAAQQLRQAILLALLHRERSGEGSSCSCSLWDAAISALVNQASNVLNAGWEPRQQGSDHPNIAPYGTLYRTHDGRWISFAVGTDTQFGGLCEVLSLEPRPEFATNAKRVRHRNELSECIRTAVLEWTADNLIRVCRERDIPISPVRTVSEALAQEESQRLLSYADQTAILRTMAFRCSFLATPISMHPAPHYNEHGEKLRAEFSS